MKRALPFLQGTGRKLSAPHPGATEPRFRSIGTDEFVAELSRDRFVHVPLATSIRPVERLVAPLRGGARRILLSDFGHRAQDCRQRAEMLRAINPRVPIEYIALDPTDYWQSRKAEQADIVIDLGQLIHDEAPDRRIARLADMSSHVVCIWSMVIPPATDLPDEIDERFRFYSASDVEADPGLRDALNSAYGKRGVTLRQLGTESRGVAEWLWFFSPESLVELGLSAGLRVTQYAYNLGGMGVMIAFEKIAR